MIILQNNVAMILNSVFYNVLLKQLILNIVLQTLAPADTEIEKMFPW